MAITKRTGKRGTSYRVEYRGTSRTFRTRREAEAFEAELKASWAQGRPVVVGRDRLADYLREWLARRDLAPSTLRGYACVVERHLIPAFGEVRLRDFTPGHWEKYARQHRGKLSGTTLLQHFRVLHKAFQDAILDCRLAYNPLDQVRAPRKEQPERRWFTAEQLEALLEAAERESAAVEPPVMRAARELYLPALLGASLGLRRGEVMALRWEDVDLEAGTLTVRHSLDVHKGTVSLKPTKGGEVAVLRLTPRAAAALREHRRRQHELKLAMRQYWADTGFVFTNEVGEPLHPDTFAHRFKRLCVEAGFPQHSFHGLRHSHATVLLRAGVPLKEVAARLRHSTVTLTGDQYGHIHPDTESKVARVVEELGF